MPQVMPHSIPQIHAAFYHHRSVGNNGKRFQIDSLNSKAVDTVQHCDMSNWIVGFSATHVTENGCKESGKPKNSEPLGAYDAESEFHNLAGECFQHCAIPSA